MELSFLNASDIVKAHLVLHGKVEPTVNTSALIKICIVISRKYDGFDVSLETIFQIAAEYGIQLAHSNWHPNPDKAAETAYLTCVMHLNRYGIDMDCSHRDLLLMIRDSWTQPNKLAVHMLKKYLNSIAAKYNQYCRTNLNFQVADSSVREPMHCHELANIASRLAESLIKKEWSSKLTTPY